MRNAIFALTFLPAITFGQSFSESNIKTLEDANHVKYSGGLSSAFSSNQNQGLNWFKKKAFELDKEFTIRMCGDGLCYIWESSGRLRVAVKQEEGDFNGRKLQGQFVRVVGTDIYGTPLWAATITREPGQIRKEAATAGTLCAGVWLVGLPPFLKPSVLQGFSQTLHFLIKPFAAFYRTVSVVLCAGKTRLAEAVSSLKCASDAILALLR